MKWAKRIILAVVVVLLVGVVSFFVSINRVIRRTIESQTSSSLNVPATLDSASLSLLGGSLKLGDFKLGSPKGFTAPEMFSLHAVTVKVTVGKLRHSPIHIGGLAIDRPVLVIEQAGGKFNFQALMDQQAGGGQPSGQPAPAKGEATRVIIDKLQINNATVVLRSGLPGLDHEISVKIPSLSMKHVGSGDGSENGAALGDVTMQVVAALAARGVEGKGVPALLQKQLGDEAKAAAQKLTGDLTKKLKGLGGGVDAVLKGEGGDGKDNVLGDLGKALVPSTATSQPSRRRHR